MRLSSISGNAATLGEWSSFLNVLNNARTSAEPLLRKAGSASRIIDHLEKQLREEPAVSMQDGWYTVQKVRRKPVMPGQLVLDLPQ
jgi:hypothetical protein